MSTLPLHDRENWDAEISADHLLDDTRRNAASRAIDYRRSVDDRPLRPDAGYGRMVATVDRPLPYQGMPPSAVIDELAATATPGLNGMTGARFFGWVAGGSHPLGVAAMPLEQSQIRLNH